MNKKSLILALSSLFMLSGCGNKNDSGVAQMKEAYKNNSGNISAPTDYSGEGYTKVTYQPKDRERYTNIFGFDKLTDQWEKYGVGDPFIMRYNGEYYLYCSTRDDQLGYRAWKSRDLYTFTYLGHFRFLSEDGIEDDRQRGQFAPEFYYWNGEFYAYGSPHGAGHYIYKSVDGTPYGDYKAIGGNIGHSIDGSVFIDDDESMYFLTAGSGAIQSYKMNSMEQILGTATALRCGMERWTEGPCMIKHNGTYFLTYTGNNVVCDGYRLGYSYSNVSPMEEFTYPSFGTFALRSDGEQRGLGHSSTVLGPNLDSYYISYHNLNSPAGPNRSYNINRLSFTNGRMSMYGPTLNETMRPVMPAYANYDSATLVSRGSFSTSDVKTGDRFSAEWNASGIDGYSMFAFGLDDSGNAGGYVRVSDKTIELRVDGLVVGTGTLKNTFDFNKIHTIRLSADNGHYCVYFDNLKKIEVTGEKKIEGGYIGYTNVVGIGSTVFSNDAFDSSDRTDANPIERTGQFFASTALEESKFTGNSGIHDIDYEYDDVDVLYSESSAVKLSNKGDYALYPIDVFEDGLYGIEMVVSQASKGSRISLQVDNNYPVCFDIDSVDFTGNSSSYEKKLEYVKQFLAEIVLTKGLHTLKVELIKGEFDFTYVSMFKDSIYKPNYSNDLSALVNKGAWYMSLWKAMVKDGKGCHMAKSGSTGMLLFGNDTITDVEVSVDINIEIASAANSKAGLVVKAKNPSLDSAGVDNSLQGYFVGFGKLSLMQFRCNYDDNLVNVSTKAEYTLGDWHNIKVVAKGNKTTTYFDGQYVYSYTDPNPFSSGYIGIYSSNCQSYFRNLVIKGI